MRQPNGCSTPAPKSSAAKQWNEELPQTKESVGKISVVAATLLRRLEQAKDRLEPSTLCTTAVEIPRSTRFTLLVQLRTQP